MATRTTSTTITAEVTDQSRRTIVGQGKVLVARKAFKIYTWLDKGYYRSDDTIKATFRAQTLDQKPVEGQGGLTLYQISYDDKNEPVEKAVQTWKLDTNVEGQATEQIKAAKPGQFRLSYKLTDSKKKRHRRRLRFPGARRGLRKRRLPLQRHRADDGPQGIQPRGQVVKLNINVNKNNGTVLLFARPTSGIYLAPKLLRIKGKSIEEEIQVVQRDMPNFFVEVLTIADGRIHTETRELVVPPEKRVVNIEIVPNQQEYKPGRRPRSSSSLPTTRQAVRRLDRGQRL